MGRRITKAPLLIAALLLLSAVFAMLFALSDSVRAPFFDVPEVSAVVSESPPEISAPVVTDTPSESEEPSPDENGIVVSLENFDISSGNLILVNSDYRYDIPAELSATAIAELKTSSYDISDEQMVLSDVIIGRLNEMMDDFYAETGLSNTTIISAFRTYDKQQTVLDERIAIAGPEEALKWAALPGHSEHHTGLAFDLGVKVNGIIKTFRGDDDYAWFKQNSYKYGFILRYESGKADITKTAYEPWHFRYVGKPHAYFIKQNGLCLEEYIDLLRGSTEEAPYTDSYNGVDYIIFHTEGAEISIPSDCDYSVSGDNIDGFIVTIWSNTKLQ